MFCVQANKIVTWGAPHICKKTLFPSSFLPAGQVSLASGRREAPQNLNRRDRCTVTTAKEEKAFGSEYIEVLMDCCAAVLFNLWLERKIETIPLRGSS